MEHIPVLLDEVVEMLNIRPGGIYLDCTLGYGGHAEAISAAGKSSIHYIGLDRDIDAIKYCQKKFKKEKHIDIIHSSYEQAEEVLEELGIEKVDGILIDLGVSSPQLDQAQRGFSIKGDGPLDMRFDISDSSKTAADILNTYPQSKLTNIFMEYGEERFAPKIAKKIVEYRDLHKIQTTFELKKIIESAVPRRFWSKNIHVATKTFQALRIEVNNELNILKNTLPKLIELLNPKGRIAIISFHSLEDRIVKNAFKEASKQCICPKEFPVCRCDKEQQVQIITKKPIVSTKIKIKNNVRSRSAKLRIAEHL